MNGCVWMDVSSPVLWSTPFFTAFRTDHIPFPNSWERRNLTGVTWVYSVSRQPCPGIQTRGSGALSAGILRTLSGKGVVSQTCHTSTSLRNRIHCKIAGNQVPRRGIKNQGVCWFFFFALEVGQRLKEWPELERVTKEVVFSGESQVSVRASRRKKECLKKD